MLHVLTTRRRWSDNDRHFGPVTFSWAGSKGYRPLAVILKSWGDGDDDAGSASLRLSLVWFTLIFWLPPILAPQRQKVYPTSWDAATVARLGRNWYWNVEVREYGFSYSDGFVQIHYGIHPCDSSRDQTWSKFLPWTQWRQVAHRIYNSDGSLVGDVARMRLGDEKGWERYKAVTDAAVCAKFAVIDYDDQRIVVKGRIEEREWRLGTGYFRWLGYLVQRKRSRAMDLAFSDEVGPEKGSWKGGMIGHSVEMLPGETPDAAMRRYCEMEHNARGRKYWITFAGAV